MIFDYTCVYMSAGNGDGLNWREEMKYSIFLPNDNEKWFSVNFTNEERAHWYAEINGLDPAEYEVRPTNQKIEIPEAA